MTNTDKKIFPVENKLAAPNAIESEMAAFQGKNWVFFQEQLAFHEENFHILRDCDQLLFANQQLNFKFDTVFFTFNDSCQRENLSFCFVHFPHEYLECHSSFAKRTIADVAYSYGVARRHHG